MLPFTARIERALFYRARSASKKGTWPLSFHPSEDARSASTESGRPLSPSAHSLSFAPYPVQRPTLQIHDRKHSQSVLFDGIEERVGKPENQSATDRPDDQRTGLREVNDGLRTPFDLVKKSRSQP